MDFLKPIGFLSILLFSTIIISQERNIFLKFDNKIKGTHIEQDELGYIWFSSKTGIYKYDGYGFNLISYGSLFGENYSGDRNFLFTKDKRNNFWISTYKGELTKLDKNGIKTSYKKELAFDQKPIQITSIRSNQKDVWFGSANGILFRFNYKTQKIDSITVIPKNNNLPQKIRSIDLVGEDEIWISTFNGSIFNYSIYKDEFNELKVPFVHSNQVVRICVDKNEKLWMATELQGLYRYDNNSSPKFKEFSKLKEFNFNGSYMMFISIFSDSSGNIWAGTDGDGLFRINVDSEIVTAFKHNEANHFSISNLTFASSLPRLQ